jgi:hypothetical protein
VTDEIAFDSSLYLREAVEAAATAYAEHAHIDLAEAANGVVARLSGIADDDRRTVVHAFCNHALYETIARRRQAGDGEAA